MERLICEIPTECVVYADALNEKYLKIYLCGIYIYIVYLHGKKL